MKPTKKQSILRSIKQWGWLAKTGKEKNGRPGWKEYSDRPNDCFLCGYAGVRDGLAGVIACRECPYFKKFGACYENNEPFYNWYYAEDTEERKKHAAQFLAQLKELL